MIRTFAERYGVTMIHGWGMIEMSPVGSISTPKPRHIAAGKEAYENALKLFHLPERPSAVFAGSDVAAISTTWAAHDRGLYVPHDVAVIGAGNIPEGEIVSPPLTTIGPASLDFQAVGDLVFSRLQTPDLPGRMHLCPWELLVRGSA